VGKTTGLIMTLKEIAIKLRAMDFYYHTAHNLVKGTVFYQDHEALAEYYTTISSDYDCVIERAINLEGDSVAELKSQLKNVYNELKDIPNSVKENKQYFVKGLEFEKDLCEAIKEYIDAGCSPGTEQLIGDVANRSEIRQYLINRRIKK
jgi:DNA-binding ferritin-like protein